MDLRYPIGKFQWPAEVTAADRLQAIADLAAAPAALRAAVAGLDDAQLDTPYRPEGWTVRQVVHHVADSHINSYCRFRLALTETDPPIKGYDENLWAALADAAHGPVAPSLQLIEGMHRRWVTLLESLTGEQWQRGFIHAQRGRLQLDLTAMLYAWHGKHHVAHITGLRERWATEPRP